MRGGVSHRRGGWSCCVQTVLAVRHGGSILHPDHVSKNIDDPVCIKPGICEK